MSSSSNKLDPEVRGLLEEIATQPAAHLLRSDPTRLRSILYPEAPRPGARDRLLSNAEDLLLRAHRDNVGRLLYTQAAVLLTQDTPFGRSISPSITVDRNLDLPDEATLERESAAAAAGLAARAPEPAAELLARCCAAGTRVQPAELLEASLRLRPSDSVRVTLALDMIRRDQLQAAEEALHEVLARHPSAMIASYAWQDLGLLENHRGRHAQAADAYKKAASAHEGRIAPLLSLFGEYLHLGQSEGALETGRRIDELASPDHSAVRRYVSGRGGARRAGEWRPTPDARTLLPQIADQLGTTSSEIAQHVFA